jgi:hypothetical protein
MPEYVALMCDCAMYVHSQRQIDHVHNALHSKGPLMMILIVTLLKSGAVYNAGTIYRSEADLSIPHFCRPLAACILPHPKRASVQRTSNCFHVMMHLHEHAPMPMHPG